MPTEDDMKRLRELADLQGMENECKLIITKPKKTYRDEVYSLWNKDLDLRDSQLAAAMGLAGEAGEVVDYMKKVHFHKHLFNREAFIKELGDVRYYLEVAAMNFGVSMEEVEQRNIEKLKKRYPNGFTSEASINRVENAKEEKKV